MPERVCKIDGCDRAHYGRGLCQYHYNASRPRSVSKNRPCGFEGCTNQRNGKVYCHAHERQLKAGKELTPLAVRNKIVDGMKKCTDCHRVLPVSEFNKHMSTIHPKCRSCWSLYGRALRYGLTRDEVLDLIGRPCDACGSNADGEKMAIDHDHETGKVRGLLCNSCNVALGMLNEDPARLHALLAYIERHT